MCRLQRMLHFHSVHLSFRKVGRSKWRSIYLLYIQLSKWLCFISLLLCLSLSFEDVGLVSFNAFSSLFTKNHTGKLTKSSHLTLAAFEDVREKSRKTTASPRKAQWHKFKFPRAASALSNLCQQQTFLSLLNFSESCENGLCYRLDDGIAGIYRATAIPTE